MKRQKCIQIIAVVILIVLFIKYDVINIHSVHINTNITSSVHSETKQITQNIVSKVDILPSQYTTEQFIAKDEGTKGFLISSSFWEQQVGAALNLWTLSKWAATIGVHPVEPFVVNSKFILPNNLSHSSSSNLLRFRDYFDLDHWNKLCSDESKLMPLISWETFLHTTSKHLIVAMVLVETDHKRNIDCVSRLQHFLNSISSFSKEMNFTVVKKVCFVFSGERISVRNFNIKLYGDFNPKQVTVWFSLWPGVNNFRIYFKETQFWRNSQSMYYIHPSKRIIADSQKYVRNYIGSEFGKYIAVSFRSVKRAKKFHIGRISQDVRTKFFDMCIKELGKKLQSFGSNQKMFLSIDLGKFGDDSATKYMQSDLIDNILSSTVGVVYKNKTTIQEYERSFITATNGIEDGGYIAAVQRTIVEHSACLVLFGGNSNFQRSILVNYVKNYKTPCVVKLCYIE